MNILDTFDLLGDVGINIYIYAAEEYGFGHTFQVNKSHDESRLIDESRTLRIFFFTPQVTE